ncbi:M24 family metallopeptidase [Salinirubrum litoreum]|uniref:M24 family metallopeptidase n=1 Tax=Salinirubrum litoreum TaxID=1126234 RepID=A0ABD5R7D6_9EURY|nr:Xaa-Pro peptidase family protein [Salinirubrum litoreum]
MSRDLSRLDSFLADAGFDGYLVADDGEDSDQRYLAGFDAPDEFVTLRADGETHLLVSGLEYGRATKEAEADHVVRYSDYDWAEKVEQFGREEARIRMLAEFVADCGAGASDLSVPASFPLGTADPLRKRDLSLTPETDEVVTEIRATKTDEEVAAIREAQRANESAMARAEELLRAASVAEDGTLRHEGEVLTSERVAEAIEVTLLREGCALDETIVACGSDAADPHDRGSGPLVAGEAIIVDIFPRSKATGYHSDMTRTFVKGEASAEIESWFDVTDEAREAALAAVEPGVTGAAVHDAVCDVYESAGHPTLRSDHTTETGFIHSTGHGVGLDVHELPRVSPGGGELKPGHVITIEPGLYDPAVGGVRIEDIVVVTDDGHENLVEYPVELVVE